MKEITLKELESFITKRGKHCPVVYFINMKDGFTKIGTTTNFLKRKSNIELSSGRETKDFFLVKGSYKTETFFFNMFSGSRKNGEWFVFESFEKCKEKVLNSTFVEKVKKTLDNKEISCNFEGMLNMLYPKTEVSDFLAFVDKFELQEERNLLERMKNDKELYIKEIFSGEEEFYLEVLKDLEEAESEFEYFLNGLQFVGFSGVPDDFNIIPKEIMNLYEKYVYKEIEKNEFLEESKQILGIKEN